MILMHAGYGWISAADCFGESHQGITAVALWANCDLGALMDCASDWQVKLGVDMLFFIYSDVLYTWLYYIVHNSCIKQQ